MNRDHYEDLHGGVGICSVQVLENSSFIIIQSYVDLKRSKPPSIEPLSDRLQTE